MKISVGILAIAVTVQGASVARAHHNLWNQDKLHGIAVVTTAPIQVKSKSGHCPPGLAKKAIPCVPPGQAKKYRRGDYIYDGYVRIDDPSRWGLRRNGYYVRAGDYVYEVNRETHEVLNLIGAIADILN
ncbi:hypothetical protein [Ruegeria sp. Ofav3-42]|uniref:hypothetical protein n=1 Tax=Ruegeria sp. Ofav3-42 TaxID=2917759 RepID=UPI001EF48C94|nr:hypothetical protein [Ruegeria sp. Ofav3-42]MCG7518951.1 hypothetical protein [Ruegeria sp. Ofav3-42]